MPAEGCGLTPLAVCVAVSHGKHCSLGELWPEGDVMGQDVFPVVRFNHECGYAQRPVEEILSTPWPLHFVGVSSGVPQLATHTHAHILRKYQLLHHETVYLVFHIQFHLLTGGFYLGFFHAILHLLHFFFKANTL